MRIQAAWSWVEWPVLLSPVFSAIIWWRGQKPRKKRSERFCSHYFFFGFVLVCFECDFRSRYLLLYCTVLNFRWFKSNLISLARLFVLFNEKVRRLNVARWNSGGSELWIVAKIKVGVRFWYLFIFKGDLFLAEKIEWLVSKLFLRWWLILF